MDKHVFICYKHDDGDFAHVLINKIEKVGFKTWIDNDELQAGEDWRNEIDQAIKDSFALIVIMSPLAKASEYVTYEWAFAWGAGVKVIPILYQETQLHPRLETLQHLNFTNHTIRPWETLIDALKNAANLLTSYPTIKKTIIPPYLNQPIEALDSNDDYTRIEAIKALAKLDHPIARQALADALQHPLRDVRVRAAIELALLKETKAVPILLEAISSKYQDEYSSLYFHAEDVLMRMGEISIPCLLESLKHSNLEVKKVAIRILGKVGNATAAPQLLECLHDENKSVRAGAAKALGRVGDNTVVPQLLECLHDENKSVRAGAAEALGRVGDNTVVSYLIEILHDEDRETRGSAIMSLGRLKATSAIPELLQTLSQEDGTQIEVIEALENFRDASVIPGLLEALHSKNTNARERAIKAIGKIGDATAVPGLLEILRDDNASIQNPYPRHVLRYGIIETLVQIGENALPYLVDSLNSPNWLVKDVVIQAICKIGSTSSMPHILKFMQESAWQEYAIEALAKFRDVNSIPTLIKTFSSIRNEKIQLKVLDLIGKLGNITIVPTVVEALQKHNNEAVRKKATEVLGQTRDASSIPILIRVIKQDISQDVIRSASQSLVKIGNIAVPEISDALQDKDFNVRRRGLIINALRQIGTPEALIAISKTQLLLD